MSNKTIIISILALFMTLAWVLEASAWLRRTRSIEAGDHVITGISKKLLDQTDGVILIRPKEIFSPT